MIRLTILLLGWMSVPGMASDLERLPAPKIDDATFGKQIQRTMRLLATSTPEKRNTVRILFYGQSITEQKWSNQVADDLKKRFPNANLVIENRALGGFASQLLVKTAETDLYSFYPDLVIFHVYGAHDKYEEIIRRIRERTTAEILQQNDHVTKQEAFKEETDPNKLPPRGDHWDAFMNHNWLPSIAKKYGTELCDQRTIWKDYLTTNQFEPKKLLRDNVHLNEHGEYLMAECVKHYLRYDEKFAPAEAEKWVKTIEIGKELSWKDGNLQLDFEGNRVDLLIDPDAKAGQPIDVMIDGKKPSEFVGTYVYTRALSQPGGKWPVVAGFQPAKVPSLEEWTLKVKKDPQKEQRFRFELIGSKTGADGEGSTDQPFVSKSGSVKINPEHWNIDFALMLAGVKPVPDELTVKWKTVHQGVDQVLIPKVTDRTIETTITVAQGLPNTKHRLELTQKQMSGIRAIRIYQPPLKGN